MGSFFFPEEGRTGAWFAEPELRGVLFRACIPSSPSPPAVHNLLTSLNPPPPPHTHAHTIYFKIEA